MFLLLQMPVGAECVGVAGQAATDAQQPERVSVPRLAFELLLHSGPSRGGFPKVGLPTRHFPRNLKEQLLQFSMAFLEKCLSRRPPFRNPP